MSFTHYKEGPTKYCDRITPELREKEKSTENMYTIVYI